METMIPQSCLQCEHRPERFLCDLPADALQAFDGIKSTARIPRGQLLFDEGQSAHSAFVICQGRVRLSVGAGSVKKVLLRIAGPGEILGLSASLAGRRHEVTAEALDNVQVAVIQRNNLRRYLKDHCDACLQVLQLLSQDLENAYSRVRSVGLSRTRRSRTSRSRLT
jgi:CRP/FNR family transcriptional regulator, cyclic AMP receptor protein